MIKMCRSFAFSNYAVQGTVLPQVSPCIVHRAQVTALLSNLRSLYLQPEKTTVRLTTVRSCKLCYIIL